MNTIIQSTVPNMPETTNSKRDISTFRKMTDSMIGTSNQAYRSWERYERTAQP